MKKNPRKVHFFRLLLTGSTLLLLLPIWGLFCLQPTLAANHGEIVISEIMYYPYGDEPDNEWVELYNPTSNAIDISGWVLTDSSTFPDQTTEGKCIIPASTILPAQDFLVVSRSALTLPGATVIQCTAVDSDAGAGEDGRYELGNNTSPVVGDNLALFDGNDATANLIYGTLGLTANGTSYDRYNYPIATGIIQGRAIGLHNPMAGWSGRGPSNSLAANWATETENAGTSGYHTAGAANNGWVGYLATPHTVTFDGNVDIITEWQPGELLGAADGVLTYTNSTTDTVKYYATWDTDDLYVGMIYPLATDQQFVVMVDTDPYDLGSNNSGVTAIDMDYCNTSFETNGKPDYAFSFHPTNGFSASTANAGSWQDWTPSLSNADDDDDITEVEFRINKSEIGVNSETQPVGLYLYACQSNQNVIAAWPPENQVLLTDVVTETASALTTRIVFDSTVAFRSPREESTRLGYQTKTIGTTTDDIYFLDETGYQDPLGEYQNWYAKVFMIQPSTDPSCAMTFKVTANDIVSEGGGGIRRMYDISTSNCPDLLTSLSLRYDDGTQPTHSDVNNAPGELRGMDENNLRLYHYNGSSWEQTYSNRSTSHNRVVSGIINDFSPFGFGHDYNKPTNIRETPTPTNTETETATLTPTSTAGTPTLIPTTTTPTPTLSVTTGIITPTVTTGTPRPGPFTIDLPIILREGAP